MYFYLLTKIGNMKIRFTLPILAAALAISLVSCDKDDPKKKTDEQVQLEKLIGTWTIVSAVNDGEDRTDAFNGFTLTLSGNYAENNTYNYSVTGQRPDPSPWWLETGTWKFGANKLTELIRDPATNSEIDMNYQVTDTNLTLTFTLPDGAGLPGSGRIQSVAGPWVFQLEK